VVTNDAWNRAMDLLESDGVHIDANEQRLVESVKQDFEDISASVQDRPEFETEGPKLAAWLVSYAIERERMGLTDYELLPS
jgi:hypothetical protein